MMDFWGQLKKRKVIRVAVAYILVAWALIQVGETTFDALTLPPWSLTLLIVITLLGFPLALVLAWAYEVTPHGVRRDPAGFIENQAPPEKIDERSPSIAVLPFQDMSEKGDQGYFCDGIAEEIINALCKIGKLQVASRFASFQFSKENVNFTEIGSKLGVQMFLEGSVRKSGDRLRITTQLINTSDGYHLWSKQFDRRLQDIFDIEEEIANSIVHILRVSLHEGVGFKQQPVDPKAYDFFLRGLSYFARHNTQDNVYARQMFTRAIDLQPDFGRAWACLAYTYGFEYMYFNASNINLEEARRASARALELAPDLADSYVASGIAHCMTQEYKAAENEFEKAIRLDSRNFEAWYFFGRTKVHEGDLKRALTLFDHASQVLPEDYQSVLLQAQLYTSLGDEDKAMEVTRKGLARVRKVLELNPDEIRALNLGAFALLRLGERDEACRWMHDSMQAGPMDSIIQYNAACFFSLAGDTETALDCLENCLIKVGNINREWLDHDSDLNNIRRHPRFATIVENFPK